MQMYPSIMLLIYVLALFQTNSNIYCFKWNKNETQLVQTVLSHPNVAEQYCLSDRVHKS